MNTGLTFDFFLGSFNRLLFHRLIEAIYYSLDYVCFHEITNSLLENRGQNQAEILISH